jgi:hypothetical protein
MKTANKKGMNFYTWCSISDRREASSGRDTESRVRVQYREFEKQWVEDTKMSWKGIVRIQLWSVNRLWRLYVLKFHKYGKCYIYSYLWQGSEFEFRSSKEFFLLHVVQTDSRARLAPYPVGTGGALLGSGRGVKLTTHLQLVPSSRKCGSIHPLPHIPSWCSA